MIAFPIMLVDCATRARIAVPPVDQIDTDTYDPETYVHWHVLCLSQLSRPMQHGEHWDNAKALAAIPVEELKTLTPHQLQERGCNCGV